MPITRTTNYIRFEFVAGDPKGNSEANPFRAADALAADVAGGWGNITNVGSCYLFNGLGIEVAGATYVEFNRETIEIINAPYIKLNLGGTGRVYFAYSNIMHTASGSSVGTFGTSCLFEASTLNYIQVFTNNGTIRNSLLRVQSLYNTGTFEDSSLISAYGFRPATGMSILRSKIYSGRSLYLYHFTAGEVRELSVITAGECISYRPSEYDAIIVPVIDSEIDYTLYSIQTSTTGNCGTTFSQTIKWMCGDGVSIKMYDKDDNIVLNTVVNNEDKNEILYASVFVQVDNVGGVNTVTINQKTIYEPFRINISKATYQDININDLYLSESNRGSINPKTVILELIRETLIISAVIINDCTTIGASDGQLEITAEGGDGSYTYSLDGVTYQAGNTFTGLAPDDYTVYVKDGQGAIATFDVTVSQPIPEAYAETILRCDLTEEVLTCDLSEEILTCDFIE